jgi:hypothetical protein
MEPRCYSQVHFFNTLRNTIAARPYAILHINEINSLLSRIENLSGDANAEYIEYISAFCRAVDNAKKDGYFPVVILPIIKYETVLSLLEYRTT